MCGATARAPCDTVVPARNCLVRPQRDVPQLISVPCVLWRTGSLHHQVAATTNRYSNKSYQRFLHKRWRWI